MKSAQILKLSALTLAMGLAAGCASSGDIETLRGEVASANAAAQRAQSTADQALSTANEAKAMATEANTRAMDTDEKINRMFKRSMFK